MGDEIQDPSATSPSPSSGEDSPPAPSISAPPSPCSSPCPTKDIGILSGILQGINLMASRSGLMARRRRPSPSSNASPSSAPPPPGSAEPRASPSSPASTAICPPIIGKLHPKYGTPYISLILFAALSSLLIGFSFVGARVEEGYLTLLDLAVIMQLVPSCVHVPRAAQTHAPTPRPNSKPASPTYSPTPSPDSRHRPRHLRRLHSLAAGKLDLDLRAQAHPRLRRRLRLRVLLLPPLAAKRNAVLLEVTAADASCNLSSCIIVERKHQDGITTF